jgi:hypothetical protein
MIGLSCRHGQDQQRSYPVADVPAPDPGGKVHSGPGKQGTRLIKLTAAWCGYTVGTTRKWVDQGYPCARTASPCTRTDPPRRQARNRLNARGP